MPDRGLLLVLGLYTFLVGITLSSHGLWYDEVLTVRSVRLDFLAMTFERVEAGHPPVFFVLLKLVVSVLGEHELVLRSISFLAGAATTLLTYRLLKLSLSDERLCIAFTVFFAVSCSQLSICHMARSYALAQLLALEVLLQVVQVRKGWGSFVFVSSLCALATYVHPSAIFPLAAYSIVLMLSRNSSPAFAIIAGSLTFIPFVIALGGLPGISGHLAIKPADGAIEALWFPGRLLLGQHFDAVPRSVALIVSLLCAYAILVCLKERGIPRFCSMSLVLVWSGTCVGCLLNFDVIGIARYFAGVTPALSICVGVAFATKMRYSHAPIWVLSLTSLFLYVEVPPFPDFLTWSRLVAAEATLEEGIVILAEDPSRVIAAQHYRPRYDLQIIGPAEKIPVDIGAGAWIALSPTSADSLDRLAHFVCSNRNVAIAAVIDLRGIRIIHLTNTVSEEARTGVRSLLDAQVSVVEW